MIEIHKLPNKLAHQGYMGAETTGSIFTKLDTKHSWMIWIKGWATQFFQAEILEK